MHQQADGAMHDLKPVLEELQTELRALYGDRLVRLVLYGSYARGTATEDSDVDVMVVLHGEVDPVEENWRMGSILADLVLKYGELISAIAVAESRYVSGNTPLLINVHREGLPI